MEQCQLIKLAQLGNKEAAKRLTDAGVLLPCHRCGGTPKIIPRDLHVTESSDKAVVFWTIKCKKCSYRLEGYGTAYRPDPAGGMIQAGDLDGRLETIRLWNTRAPILSESELKKLEENT